MNRIDRLFGILLRLQRRKRGRAQDLARHFEVSELGVPIISLPNAGYELPEGFSLPPLFFTPGVGEGAFLETVADTQAAIARLPGYLSREVLKGEDGLWVDVVRWQSKADALAAAEAFATLPEVAPFAAMIDETQMTMLHLGQVRSFA